MKTPDMAYTSFSIPAGRLLILSSRPDKNNAIRQVLEVGGYSEILLAPAFESDMELLSIADQSGFVGAGVDLILLDFDSAAQALELCRRIKNIMSFQDIPIILITPSSNPETMQMAFAYGAMDYVASPVRDYELLTRTRSALRLKYEIDRRKAREKELLESARQLADLTAVLKGLSVIDTLTGVGNRRLFDRTLNQEWRRCFRGKQFLSLIMIDVDHFKDFNDKFGHIAGDDCLKQVAQMIRNCLRRAGDTICRYGGEEFAVLLPDTPMDGSYLVADSIRNMVEKNPISVSLNATRAPLTVSVGVCAAVPIPGIPPIQFVAAADAALYDAKKAGRNAVKKKVPRAISVKKAA